MEEGLEATKITVASFDHVTLDKRRSACVSFNNVSYAVSLNGGKKEILKRVSGKFQPGKLTAIMGSSGAGKSTLMNVLAGFIRSGIKGDILVNDEKRDMDKFRKISSYIMQADELCPLLTVSESMELAANLKLGNTISLDAKTSLIDEILGSISLMHVKDTRTSILSSGERKRLAVALELVKNPPVLFFDEPTSRLDSSSCVQFVSLLRSLAQSGRTVICVIHQPSSSVFEMFDELYMMGEGQCIFQGPTSGLVGFLSTNIGLVCPEDHNPADFVIDVAVGKYGNMLEILVEASNNLSEQPIPSSSTAETVISDDNGSEICDVQNIRMLPSDLNHHPLKESNKDSYCDDYKASFWTQFVLLYRRSLTCSMRDTTLTHLRIAIQLFLAFVVGLIYFGIGNEASKAFDNVSLLFINQFVFMFSALMATCLTFPVEFPVVKREYLNNWYTIPAYYFAKSAVDLPFEIVNSAIYAGIVYFMTNQPYEVERFFTYLCTGLLNSLVAQSIGLALGVAFDLMTAALMAPVVMNLCVLLGGLMTASTAPVYLRWILYTTYFRYSYRSSMIAIYGFGRKKLDCSLAYCIFKLPETVLEEYGVDIGIPFWVDMVVLVSYFFLVRLLAYFLLWHKIRYAKQ